MSPSFLLTKLLRNNTIAVFSTTKPSNFIHNSGLFLRRISSNTSCAAQLSSPVGHSAANSATSTRRLAKSTLTTKKELNHDYSVSYLVESCGLSPKDALSVSEKIHFATPDRPNSVLDLLSNHGFSSTQIANAVRICPQLLGMDAEKIILPKLEFFKSMGLSTNDLARIVSYSPFLLGKSLKNQIEPVCKFVKSFLLYDKNVCMAIKHAPWLLLSDHEKLLGPNIAMLQKHEVPGTSISLLLTNFPKILLQNPEQLSAGVSKVEEMGFDPSKSTFVLALHAISGKGKKVIWDRSYSIYTTKWGWSEEDILSAFKKHPHCMVMSETKLNSSMDFLVNTMGWSSKSLAKQPCILFLSLKKRIIPRCSVIRVLWRKGLLSKDLSPITIMLPVERDFLKRYVTKYEKEIPQLSSVYEGKVDPLDL